MEDYIQLLIVLLRREGRMNVSGEWCVGMTELHASRKQFPDSLVTKLCERRYEVFADIYFFKSKL